jgi:hypothetical protein
MSTTEVRSSLQAQHARLVLADSRPTLPERLELLALPIVPDDDEDRENVQLAIGSAVVALRGALVRLHNAAPQVRHYPTNIIQALAEHRDRIKRVSDLEAELRIIQDRLQAEG